MLNAPRVWTAVCHLGICGGWSEMGEAARRDVPWPQAGAGIDTRWPAWLAIVACVLSECGLSAGTAGALGVGCPLLTLWKGRDDLDREWCPGHG